VDLFSDFESLNIPRGISEKKQDDAWLSDLVNSGGASKVSDSTGSGVQGPDNELQNNFAFLQNLTMPDNRSVDPNLSGSENLSVNPTPLMSRPVPAESLTGVSPSSGNKPTPLLSGPVPAESSAGVSPSAGNKPTPLVSGPVSAESSAGVSPSSGDNPTPLVSGPVPAESSAGVSHSAGDQVSGDQLDNNFDFIQSLSVGKNLPKLEDIKLHSANSSIGDYDDCTFMRSSFDEGDGLDGSMGKGGNFADPCRPTTGGGVPDNEDAYDDLSDVITNLKSPQESAATGQDEMYDDLNFIATPGKVENSETLELSDKALDEDYDDIPFFTEGKEMEEKKTVVTEQGDDEYDDLLSIIKTPDDDKDPEKQSGEVTQDNVYIDIVEYDKFSKAPDQKETTGEEIFENFNFIQSLSKNAPPTTDQNVPVLSAHQSESVEDDTYEPIEQFRSMLTESSQVAGQVDKL
jgi:hypothetical protein